MRRRSRFVMWGWLLLTPVLPASAQLYAIADLGTLGGKTSFAFSANALGQVAGSSDKGDGNAHAFLWTRNARWHIQQSFWHQCLRPDRGMVFDDRQLDPRLSLDQGQWHA